MGILRRILPLAIVGYVGAFSPATPRPLASYQRAGQETAVATLRMSAVPQPSRRAVLGSAAAVIAGNLIQGAPAPSAAARLPADDDVTIYVGAGCFWHVQHEMTVAEQKLLGRGDDSFTAIAGYAGGSKLGKDGKVCYHNMAFDSDYGKLGHTEVVAVRVPQDSVPGFVEAYVNLFNGKGIRADPQDQGGEYRSAIGLPGGISNAAVSDLKAAAAKKGMTVLAGKGDEDDTLRARSIYVYDTSEFPFHAGELYHQYHNDMVENYGKKYNALRTAKAEQGSLAVSKCPGDAKFVGMFASGDFASAGIFQDKSVNN